MAREAFPLGKTYKRNRLKKHIGFIHQWSKRIGQGKVVKTIAGRQALKVSKIIGILLFGT